MTEQTFNSATPNEILLAMQLEKATCLHNSLALDFVRMHVDSQVEFIQMLQATDNGAATTLLLEMNRLAMIT